MKAAKKRVVIALIILTPLLYIFGIFFIFGHHKLNKEFPEKYYPLFNSKFIEHIDLLHSTTNGSRDNNITSFPFYPQKKKRLYDYLPHISDTLYSISILEFKHLYQLTLNDIVINYKDNLSLIGTNYTWEV